MFRKKPIYFLILFSIIFSSLAMEARANPNVSSEAAVLMDMNTGQIIYQKNIDQRVYPASITKILTALVAIKKGNLGDSVKVSREAVMVGGSHVGLQEDEVLRLDDLLYILMISSANDAAVAVAEHIGGSVEGFSRLMIQEAHSMGALNSNFTNPHGLHHPDHYTTAGDMSIIAREAMKNTIFRKIVGTYSYQVERIMPRPVKGIPQVDFVNHNKMLWPGSRFGYQGATGVKTGYTDEARQTLVASASRDGRELMAVVMKSENFGMYLDASALLDYGFNEFKQVLLSGMGTEISRTSVKKGAGEIGIVTGGSFFYHVPEKDNFNFDKKIHIDGEITAPIKKGQKVGSMAFFSEGKEIGSVDLVSDRDVERKFFSWWYLPVMLMLVYIYARLRVKSRRRRYMTTRRKNWY